MDAQAVKTVGGLAQIAGVTWLVWDLLAQSRHTGQLDKLKARLRSSWQWVQIHLLRQRRDAEVHAVSAAASIAMTGSVTVTASRGFSVAPAGATVEERLAAIEQWSERLVQQFAEERRAMEQARQEDRAAFQRDLEAATRQTEARIGEVKEAVSQLEGVTVGGVSLRWYSVPVLLLGIACTTWPDGIAKWLVPWLSPLWFATLIAILVAAVLIGKILADIQRDARG